MSFNLVLCLLPIAFVSAYEDIIELPDQARPLLEDCKTHAKELPEEMQWQGHLACLNGYFTSLPADNLTDNDWALFLEAQNNSFGFKPPPSGFRIRKEIRTLTEKERNDVAEVFYTMYKQGTLRKFGRLHGLAIETAHKGAAFLLWHRVFLTHFEEEMRKINTKVSLPYWDYTIDNNITKPTDSVVWTECFFGEGNGTIQSGPFKQFYGAHGAFVGRNANRNCETRLINKLDIDNVKTHCKFQEITTGTGDYFKNTHNLELLHDGVHDWIGGDMGIVRNSAYDPVFWMHHAFIDYIYEAFRKKQKECGGIDIEADYRPLNDLCLRCTDGQTHGHGPDDPMWGYSHLRNIDGLWLNWTTVFYSYDPAPSCPDRCSGKYLYCDKNADPRYPDGLCLTATQETCQLKPERMIWVTGKEALLEPRMPCHEGIRLKGLPGDGRTRDMSEEEARQILKKETEPPQKPKKPKDKQKITLIKGVCIGIGAAVGTGVLVGIVVVCVMKKKKGGYNNI